MSTAGRVRPPPGRTVSATLPKLWLVFGVMHGLSEAELCAAAGFRPCDVVDRDRQVPRAWYVALRLAVIERLPHVDVGIEVGKMLSVAQLGYLGMAMQQCDTPRAAMHMVLRYLGFLLGKVNDPLPRIEDHGESVDWVIPFSEDDPPEATESHFVHILGTLHALLGRPATLLRVRFVHRRELLRDRLQAVFGVPVEFGCTDSRVSFARADLDSPCTGANALTRKHLEAELDKHIAQLEAPFVELATRVIEALLAKGEVSQANTARRMGLGTRSLQRRLTEHGTSYDELLAETRQRLGQRLLSDPSLPIYQVAFALGYSDVGSFNRAWKRWTGASPGAARQPGVEARGSSARERRIETARGSSARERRVEARGSSARERRVETARTAAPRQGRQQS
jgi:AraC-like DNA-binding protein